MPEGQKPSAQPHAAPEPPQRDLRVASEAHQLLAPVKDVTPSPKPSTSKKSTTGEQPTAVADAAGFSPGLLRLISVSVRGINIRRRKNPSPDQHAPERACASPAVSKQPRTEILSSLLVSRAEPDSITLPRNTCLAEGEGFEPPLPARVKRFSRPPVSTAHTSLRIESRASYIQRLAAFRPALRY